MFQGVIAFSVFIWISGYKIPKKSNFIRRGWPLYSCTAIPSEQHSCTPVVISLIILFNDFFYPF